MEDQKQPQRPDIHIHIHCEDGDIPFVRDLPGITTVHLHVLGEEMDRRFVRSVHRLIAPDLDDGE